MRFLLSLSCLFFYLPVLADGFSEVNLQRTRLALPPFQEDKGLTQFAQAKAEWQAARMINLDRGYNGHEGPAAPRGCVEGTGCGSSHWGWISCAMDRLGTCPAGAGVAIGPDGKRYMCLILRGPQNVPEHPYSATKPVIKTAHLSSPPVVSRSPQRISPEPKYTYYTKPVYHFDSPVGSSEKIIEVGRSNGPLIQTPHTKPLTYSPPVCPHCGKIHG